MADSLTSLSKELGADCICDDACTDFLQVPSGSADMEMLTPLPASPASLEHGVRVVYAIGREEQEEWDAIAVGTQCKQIGASAYCALNNSPDFNVVVAAARLLLALCSLKGSSAYGVSNTNLLAAIPGALLRAVLHELKFPAGAKSKGQARPAATARAKRTVTLSLDLGAGGGELRRSARAPAASQSQSQSQQEADEDEDEEEEAETEVEAHNGAEEHDWGEEDARPRRGKSDAPMRVSPAGLRALVIELGRRVSLFVQRSDDFPLESCIEGLSAAAFLAAMRPEFGLLASDASAALAALGLSGERGMMSLFKSLLPALTMSGRDVRLPDVALHKLRAQCQRAAADVAAKVVARCASLHIATAEVDEAGAEEQVGAAAASANVPPAPPASPSAGGKRAAEEERTPGVAPRKSRADKARDAKAAKAAAAAATAAAAVAAAAAAAPPSPAAAVPFRLALPTPYACAVGLLQRMTVGVPDRAQPRGVVLTSIALLLRALAEAGSSDQEAPEGARGQGRAAAFHYLLFLEKLSRSTKTTHRAYSLDIAVAIMACDWLWDVDVGTDGAAAPSAAVGAPATLVAMVLGRCRDVASTVRSRAIGALSDLLDSLGPASPRAMAEILRTAAMGGDLASLGAPALAPGARACSLLDTLRDRAADDKPLVRAKAMQAFGRAFCLDWPSCAPAARSGEGEDMCLSPAADVQWSQLLLLEEDVGVLVLGCGDKALSGRKQALTSLTALVQARPRDARLQAAWVAAALPLASDPESSVQAKVAQCCHALLVEGAMAWASLPEKKEAPAGKGRGTRPEPQRQQEEQRAQASLAWALLDAIALAGQGHSKLLRTAVTGMLQQGLLGTGPSGVKTVVSAIKTACCANLGRDGLDHNEEGDITVPAASVARGGWVLLEALLSPDAGRDANSQAAASLALGQAGSGSADFVVRCFLSQVPGDSLQGSDTAADCVRMLRVLEKVASGVSAGDAAKVGRKLQQLLVGMQCDAGFVAAAVAVRFALSKAAGAAGTDRGVAAGTGLSDAVCVEVVQWAGQLLACAHAVLYGGVWGSLPERADSLYPLEEMDCAPGATVKAALLADRRDGLSEATKGAMACSLFVVGELAMLGFSVEEDEPKRGAVEDGTRPSFSVSPAARAFRMCLPAPLVVLVQMLMDARLPHPDALSSVCDLLHEAPPARGPAAARLPCPDAVRAHAFVTMGKLCLRDRMRARGHVNVFLRELVGYANTSQDAALSATVTSSSSSSAAIRSNCLLVLGDLCVRYTNLVDRHIGAMAACLQDSDVLVRRHALVMLTQLLLQDYLKWRGLLLFRFLAAAVDTDNETAELARVVLRSTLLVRSPDFFSQHLAEAVLIFNGCCDHPAYVAAASCGSEGASSLVTMDGVILGGGGPRERARRLRLYGVMMESFTDEQRIHVTAKLVQDVLSYAVDHAAALQAGGSAFEHALEDALLILQSPLLRVGRRTDAEDGDEEGGGEEEEAGGGAQDKKGAAGLAGAKSKVLKSLSKQHLVAHTLPVVASLKHVLEAARSPLQGALMDFLLCLVRNHRAECAEAFEADPCLKGEVEYDLKQHERNKAQREAQRLAEEAERAQREAQAPLAGQDRRLSRGLPQSTASPRSGKPPSAALSPVPALRRSLGGHGSAARTPRQALLLGGGREDEANEALLAERLLGAFMAGGAGADEAASAEDRELPSHASRRRSWSVVVGRLEPQGENEDPNPFYVSGGPTPAKKRTKAKASPPAASSEGGETTAKAIRPARNARLKA